MSRDWNIRCVTCGETHAFDDGILYRMRDLIEARREIAALAPLVRAAKKTRAATSGDLEISVGIYRGEIDLDWFEKHRDHDLRPIDEYGELDTDCGKIFQCPCCQSSKSCRLDEGHAGDHDTRSTKELAEMKRAEGAVKAELAPYAPIMKKYVDGVRSAWLKHWEPRQDHRYGRDFCAFLGEAVMTHFGLERRDLEKAPGGRAEPPHCRTCRASEPKAPDQWFFEVGFDGCWCSAECMRREKEIREAARREGKVGYLL